MQGRPTASNTQTHFWNRQGHSNGAPAQHFWNRPHPAQQGGHPSHPQQHFWNRSAHRQPTPVHRGEQYYDYNPMNSVPGPHSEFRQGPTRWEHTQYADNAQYGGHPTTGGRPKMSHREKNMYATPFGTPGFAAENLLAENPWTHDTLGYDYYDYFADQAVRGPFGVAPGSVVPPSQRQFVGRNGNAPTGAPKKGFGYKLFHKGHPSAPSGGNYPNNNYQGQQTNGSKGGLNRGYMPPGAQYAHTNVPYVGEAYHEDYEDVLPTGGWERYEVDVSQTTHQDVVYGGRGTNAARSQYGNTRNPSMTTGMPMNIPTAASNTTTFTSTTTDGLSVPITDSMEKRETVISAENPTTGLPLNNVTTKHANK